MNGGYQNARLLKRKSAPQKILQGFTAQMQTTAAVLLRSLGRKWRVKWSLGSRGKNEGFIAWRRHETSLANTQKFISRHKQCKQTFWPRLPAEPTRKKSTTCILSYVTGIWTRTRVYYTYFPPLPGVCQRARCMKASVHFVIAVLTILTSEI